MCMCCCSAKHTAKTGLLEIRIMCPELSDMRIVSVSEHYKSTLVEQEFLALPEHLS